MQDRCAKQNKFVEAELCKQRIETFKKKEKEKLLDELKLKHQEQMNQLDIEKNEELDQFNTRWDVDYFNLRNKFEALENDLKQVQLEEFKQKKDKLAQDMENFIPKPSSEAINLNRIIEALVKQKE